MATTPIAWTCPDHRDLFESQSGRDLLTLHWPPLDVERVVTNLRPKPAKGKGGKGGKKNGRKSR